MVHRWSLAGAAATALLACGLLVSGCGSDSITIPPPSEPPSTSAAEAATDGPTAPDAPDGGDAGPSQRLDAQACLDVTSANLDLAVSSSAEEARAAADVFARYDPPPDVTEAIEHFVGTGGVQYDDPEFDEFNARIDNWIKEVCPL